MPPTRHNAPASERILDVAERLAQLGVEAMPLTPNEFGALVAKEVTTYADFVRRAKMKVE